MGGSVSYGTFSSDYRKEHYYTYVCMYVCMRKSNRLKVPVTVSLDYEYLKKYEETHGKGKISSLFSRVLQEEVELEKNTEAQRYDPLGLCKSVTQSGQNEVPCLSVNTRQSTLFEVFGIKDRRDEIVKFVHSVRDPLLLNQIEANCKCMLKVSEVHRQKIIVRK